jgi:hypothetical protein
MSDFNGALHFSHRGPDRLLSSPPISGSIVMTVEAESVLPETFSSNGGSSFGLEMVVMSLAIKEPVAGWLFRLNSVKQDYVASDATLSFLVLSLAGEKSG